MAAQSETEITTAQATAISPYHSRAEPAVGIYTADWPLRRLRRTIASCSTTVIPLDALPASPTLS